jgi:hypothetical protein
MAKNKNPLNQEHHQDPQPRGVWKGIGQFQFFGKLVFSIEHHEDFFPCF